MYSHRYCCISTFILVGNVAGFDQVFWFRTPDSYLKDINIYIWTHIWEYFTFLLLWAKKDKNESGITHTLDKIGLEAVFPILSYYYGFTRAIFIFSFRTGKHSIPTTKILDLKSGSTNVDNWARLAITLGDWVWAVSFDPDIHWTQSTMWLLLLGIWIHPSPVSLQSKGSHEIKNFRNFS